MLSWAVFVAVIGPPACNKQHTCWLQSPPPCPELPSKKQSCVVASMLSPGMPVANESSRSSFGPEHSGSKPSILPSMSLSTQSEHSTLPPTVHWPPYGGASTPTPPSPSPLPPPPSVVPPLLSPHANNAAAKRP